MAASIKTNRKRKAVSKNKKKGWKKVDISELEDFLEDERLQERTGGLVADKTDDSLFFVDKTVKEKPEGEADDEGKKGSVQIPLRKSQRKNRPLRCFSNLEPDPHTKPAHIPHNIRTTPRLSKQERDRLANKKPTAKQLQAQKQSKDAREDRIKNRVGRWNLKVNADLWDDQPADKDVDGDEHYLLVTKKRRVNVPSYYHKKTSTLPAVEVPHPGASYNPAYDDHQDLLWRAHEVEVKKEKAMQKLFNALDAKFPSKDDAPTQQTWLEEMSAGLHSDPTREDEVALPAEDLDKISVNPPVRREDLKTRKQRRKERERRIEAKRLARAKVVKQKKNEFNRLKSIKKEIRKEELAKEERAKRKEEMLEKNKDKPKKLGKYKYEDPDLELQLSEELPGSLRLLKPEGFLIKDMFHSLQKRNIIETREKAKKSKKRRPKFFERKSHREIT
ncbi:ribosome biogenesis protein NOP53-like isoform X1 [Haliotis asinina]|uniref:ribosome biogenesis protein NOP53-like isoform X1 n=1 Tax=Haliotis asinina TaxID=109174 RepID=UPI0035321FE3